MHNRGSSKLIDSKSDLNVKPNQSDPVLNDWCLSFSDEFYEKPLSEEKWNLIEKSRGNRGDGITVSTELDQTRY